MSTNHKTPGKLLITSVPIKFFFNSRFPTEDERLREN